MTAGKNILAYAEKFFRSPFANAPRILSTEITTLMLESMMSRFIMSVIWRKSVLAKRGTLAAATSYCIASVFSFHFSALSTPSDHFSLNFLKMSTSSLSA